ncbi:hypothetical protein SAURM35S_05592 [Streptomyces aurantiogriseus]
MINVETNLAFPALPVPNAARVHPDAARRVRHRAPGAAVAVGQRGRGPPAAVI